mgnify:CR=1 FL=1
MVIGDAENMDIVDFVEKIMSIELFDYQKEMLRAISKIPPNSKIVYGRNGRIYVISSTSVESQHNGSRLMTEEKMEKL